MGSNSCVAIFLLLCLSISGIISLAVAETNITDIGSWNPYEGWDVDLASKVGTGLFPTVEIKETPTTQSTAMTKTSPDFWIKMAYYPPGSASGQPAILAGYVGGKNYNADVTIGAKKEAGDEFHDIVTIKPQENGVFVWAVPDKLKNVTFYQAKAIVGGVPVKSEIVKISDVSAYSQPK